MDFIVDVQGFKRPMNKFVLKEISIIAVNGDYNEEPLTLIFKPPTTWSSLPAKYKAMNAWLERNFHGLQWNSGEIAYSAAATKIRAALEGARTIYIKGLEKSLWLARIVDPSTEIIDMETLDCPSLQQLPKISPNIGCPLHSFDSKYNCANANVKSLKKWLNVYQALCNRGVFE